MVIDGHVHFWNYIQEKDDWTTPDMGILRRDYLPANLQPILEKAQVDGVVLVQVNQTEEETNYLMNLSHSTPWVKGIVGWVDMQSENLTERLAYFSKFPIIKGWRHIAQAEPNDFFKGTQIQAGIQQLASFKYTYDILVYHYQLEAVLALVQQFPDQKFVIDHCAKPGVAKKIIDPWRSLMKEIASCPNVYCKLSGLLTETNWKQWEPTDFYPYLDVVFESFGTSRLLFGSDWPVLLLSGEYLQWKELLLKYMETLPDAERENVMGNNAIKFYNLI